MIVNAIPDVVLRTDASSDFTISFRKEWECTQPIFKDFIVHVHEHDLISSTSKGSENSFIPSWCPDNHIVIEEHDISAARHFIAGHVQGTHAQAWSYNDPFKRHPGIFKTDCG